MSNLQVFVKKIMLSLACHNHLDFRDYDKDIRDSRLFSLVISNGWQIDAAIQQICDDLVKQEEFFFLLECLKQNKDSGSADDLFNYIISFVGLNTVHTMHPDVTDAFCKEMMDLLLL